MRPERWREVKRLFDAALNKPLEERGSFVAGISELDPELGEELEKLLDNEREDSFLERPPEPPITTGALAEPERTAETAEPTPTKLGPYRLLKEIGRGGMGRVHLAVRDDDQYKKRVAIKLLRKGMDSEDILRRFRNERQILAAVEHANIAKLYDGGTTEDGSPYFVMELVEGRPLDAYCDTHRLSIPERLELFRKVCAAVQVAHQNLVVHRDLKPGNILVTADGEPKLLDFGIAKLLNPELSSATVDPTRFQVGLMTPAYASPEQVRGEPITTASDVYSLGVILYELLTGHRPYQVDTTSLHELTRVVCDAEPTRPSQMIGRKEEVAGADGTTREVTPATVSRTRRDSTERLRRKLSGDLDNIIMMALRKEPQRRYVSVEQLSEDIRRHLEGRPVRARKPTLAYIGSKLVRRHRAAMAATILFIASITGFTIVTARARAQAEREAAKAQAINEFMQKTLASANPFSGEGRDVTVVEALGLAAEELESSFPDEPDVQAAIKKTLGVTYRELGRLDEAEPLLVEALSMRRELLGESHPDVADSLDDLASLKSDRGDFDEAERLYREALSRHRALPDAGRAVATDLGGLGMVLYQKGDFEAAEPFQREALAMNRELDGDKSGAVSIRLNDLALIVEARGNFEEAESLYRQVLAIDRERLGEEHPEVATTLSNLGLLLSDAQGNQAGEPYLREALAIRRKTLGEHPDTAVSLNVLGQVLSDRGDAAGAERLYREALDMQRRLLGNDHTDMTATLISLARELRLAGKYDEAEPLMREAIAIWRKQVGDLHPRLATDISNLAQLLAEKGDYEEAEARHQEACSILEKVHGDEHWMTGYCSGLYGAFLSRLGRYDEAETLLLRGYDVVQRRLGPEHPRTHRTLRALVELYRAWEKREKAAEYRARLPDDDDSETAGR